MRARREQNVDMTPPAAVREAARLALAVRATKPPSQRGMTSIGLARARDLANGRTLSVRTVRRMFSYLSRHRVDKAGSTWSERGRGWQAWNGWGGDAGLRWAREVLRRVDGDKGNSAEEHAALHVGVETAVMEAGERRRGHRTVTMEVPVADALVDLANGAARNVRRRALDALVDLGLADASGRLTVDGHAAARQLARRFDRWRRGR